jgi:integrase/recombinase XerD
MGVKLRRKINRSGSISLYLDIYSKGRRHCEFLSDLKLVKPRSPYDRVHNKNCLELAKQITINRAKEIVERGYDLKKSDGRWVNVVDWMLGFIDNYRKKDKRNLQGVLNRFIKFIKDEGCKEIFFGEITEQLLIDFQDYLRRFSKGEGASSYFNRFKKMLKVAFREELLSKDLSSQVKTIAGVPRKRDILSHRELELLARTSVSNLTIKRAFLLSCMTGLRWIDIKTLKWGHVNVGENVIQRPQEKTQREVRITLNDSSIKLLGDPADRDMLVFDLPTQNGANKILKSWVKKAGIDKCITWHNGRHTFGTNLIASGTDIITTANLLGHTSLKYITTYVKIANEQKQRATDKLVISLGDEDS